MTDGNKEGRRRRWPNGSAVVMWTNCRGHYSEVIGVPRPDKWSSDDPIVDLHPLLPYKHPVFGSPTGYLSVLRGVTPLARELLKVRR